MMGKRLFITGGTGFFGKSMLDYRVRHAELQDAEWVVLSRDPNRFKTNNPSFAQLPGVTFVAGDVRNFAFPPGLFDEIVHAATPAVTTLPDDEMRSIINEGTVRVIDFAKACGCRRLLFTSSGAVYGPRMSAADESSSCLPETTYGKGKLQSEQMLLASGLDVRIARCFAFVGPHLNRDIHYAIGNFIRDCLEGRDIVLNGDGTPRRSYLYADDLVEWLFAILERGEPGRAYNVGSDAAVSIRELAETVRRVLGGCGEIVVKGTPQPGATPSVYVPKTERARRELGLTVKTDLESAILKTVKGEVVR